MKNSGLSGRMYFILKLAVAMCFIGHGAFGIITKPIWCNYFAVFGIGRDMAYQLMPVVGSFDIFFGISMLIYPTRAVACWLVIWGLITASLRPLSGEPFAEFIERAGNFGVPAAFIILNGGFGKSMFSKVNILPSPDNNRWRRVYSCLHITVFLLLLGHGWLNMTEKPALLNQYKSLGFIQTASLAQWIGSFEILSAFFILIHPTAKFLLLIFIWKMISELFYPHYPLFEWIERGGSYAAIISLYLCLQWKPERKITGVKNMSDPSTAFSS